MKLKIFTDLSLLDKGFPIEMLIPFNGTFNKEDEEGAVMSGRFDKFLESGKEYFELTSIEDCDVCLFPVVYRSYYAPNEFNTNFGSFIDKVKKSNKELLVFAGHDQAVKISPYSRSIFFNSAIIKSKNKFNVNSWPHFFEDLLVNYNDGIIKPKEKSKIPVIGFCGYAPPFNIPFGKEKLISFMKLATNYVGLLKYFPENISHSYRARAILGLKNSKIIRLNLRIKSTFAFGPTGQLNTGSSDESNFQFRKNFVNNILESDYTLCVRGIGNNSVRFYETLCCGRIPVFVNTDCALPFDHVIDWKTLSVWVEEKDIDRIDEIVANFHQNISEDDFLALQLKLRGIWENYFTPEGFYKNMDKFINLKQNC